MDELLALSFFAVQLGLCFATLVYQGINSGLPTSM